MAKYEVTFIESIVVEADSEDEAEAVAAETIDLGGGSLDVEVERV